VHQQAINMNQYVNWLIGCPWNVKNFLICALTSIVYYIKKPPTSQELAAISGFWSMSSYEAAAVVSTVLSAKVIPTARNIAQCVIWCIGWVCLWQTSLKHAFQDINSK